MSVTLDIVRSWKGPAAVVARQLSGPRREDRAFAILMAGCLLVFVGALPRLARDAALSGEGFLQDATYAFFGWMVVWPLVFYLIAAVMALLVRGLSLYGSRVALFWALLASSPAALLYGLAVGLAGPGPGATAAGLIWPTAFGWFWIAGLRVAATRGAPA